jgi:hypothetical protein
MALSIGRKGRLYLVKEAVTYGLLQDGNGGTNTLSAAARAMRHIDFKASYDPFNRVNSAEKKTSPGQVAIFDRRVNAGLGSLVSLIHPSGTLNTLSEDDPVFEAAFGAKTNVTIAATVLTAASTPSESAPTTTAFAITDIGALAVNDVVQVSVGGKLYARFIQVIASAAGAPAKKLITIAPALPAAPVLGDTVKGGLTYKLSTDLAISLAFLHVFTGFRRELRGVGLDKFAIALDANAEPQFTASGPGSKQFSDAAAVADPTTFTTVGGNPPSGLVGETYIGNIAYLMKKAGLDLTNGLKVRNEEYGANADSAIATEVYRDGRRAVGVSLDAFVETAATLYDLAKAGTTSSFFNQTGRTSGSIIAVFAPKVTWSGVPDTDEPEGAASWSAKGAALESADGANDEVQLALC